MKKVVKLVLIKSAGYRLLTIIYEILLATLLPYLGVKAITQFVLINNTIKFLGYFVYELIWVGYLRTRLNLVDKLRRWVSKS